MPRDNLAAEKLAVAIEKIQRLTERAKAAETEAKRLRELLDDVVDYTNHKPDCLGPHMYRDERCTCGVWAMWEAVALVLQRRPSACRTAREVVERMPVLHDPAISAALRDLEEGAT